jgi:hypothetical protein
VPFETTLHDLVKQIRLAKPHGTVYLGMYRADAKFIVPDGAAFIYGFLGQLGREFTVIQTRHDDVNGARVPRELIYFCVALHDSMESAAPYLYQIASHVHSICGLSANAGGSVIKETLLTEFPFAKWQRLSRKLSFSEVPQFPLGGRILDKDHTFRLAGMIWQHPERQRILLAVAQYEEALRTWRSGSSPLLCLYLWMAVEAITEAVLAAELIRRKVTITELMDELKIPHDQHSQCRQCKAVHSEETICSSCGAKQAPTKNDRRYHLLAWVRRELIFKGDKEIYDAVRKTSNGIEHGSAMFSEIWAVDLAVYDKTARYIREAIFNLIDFPSDSVSVLGAAPYSSVYESPEPPRQLGYNTDPPPQPYSITPPKPFDYYTLDFQPRPTGISLDKTGREFVVDYESGTSAQLN